MLIDTHAHLHGKEYEADRTEVVARARAAGVRYTLLVGVDLADTRRALDVARTDPGFFRVVAGVHPHHADSWDRATEAAFRDEIFTDPLVVALGEIGLDYHYDFSPRPRQQEVFERQLQMSRELDKPVVIHCREAYDELMAVLESFYGATSPDQATHPSDRPASALLPRGVLHCYFGSLEQARRAWAIGYLLGIGGSSTFKKTEELHEVIRQAPLEQLILETDAPYMSPIPFRGKRNESAHVSLVADRVAELKGVSRDLVLEVTGRNAVQLFRMGDGDRPSA